MFFLLFSNKIDYHVSQ
jgi:hypothetical protein